MRFREWCLHHFPGGTFSQNDTQYLCKNHLRGDTNASLSFTTKDGGKYNDFGGEHGQVKFFCHENGLPTWEGADEWKEATTAAPSRDNSALRLWEASQPATSHPYATRKGISVEGLRVSSAGELLVPCFDARGELVAVERIAANGEKKSLGPKKGAYHVIGGLLDESLPLLIAEGFATAASLRTITGWNVACAFGEANIKNAVEALRKRFYGNIAIAPDAQSADLAGTFDVVPFPDGYEKNLDWNDLHAKHGVETTKDLFRSAWTNRRKVEKPSEPEKPKRKKFNALELYHAELRTPSWAIDQLIPEGLSVLASPPKVGKSYFCLQAALAVAQGVPFLGQRTTKGRVLLLSLEDTEIRLKKRLTQMVPDLRDIPANLDMEVDFPRLDEHGLSELEAEIRDNGYRLVICDTWGRLKPVGQCKKGENAYETDVRLISEVKRIADKYETSILLVHHLKKGGSKEGDWLESLSGSMGLSATVDGLLAIERERKAEVGILKRTGRDLEEDDDIGLKWLAPGWEFNGDARAMLQSAARREILSSISKAREPVSPAYIAADTQQNSNTVRWHLMRMVNDGLIVRTSDNKYMIPMPEEEKDEKTNTTNRTNATNRTNRANATNSTNTTNVSNDTNDDLFTNGEEYSDTNGLQDSSPVGVGGVGLGTNSIKRSDTNGLHNTVGAVGAVGGTPSPCGEPSLKWLEEQPGHVREYYESERLRIIRIGFEDEAERRALENAYKKFSEVAI